VVTKRPRRHVRTVIALGAVALGGLAACRNEAGTAAYVGDTRITYDQVNAVATGAPSAGAARQIDCAAPISSLTFIELANDYAAEQHLTLPIPTSADLTSAAQAFGVSADKAQTSQFVKVCATAIEDNNFLLAKVTAVSPTDAELQPGFLSAVAAGIIPDNQFEAYKQQIMQVNGVGEAFGLQRALATTAKKNTVVINPRFAPSCSAVPCPGVSFAILRLQTQAGAAFDAVTLPLTSPATAPAVVDRPAPAGTVVPPLQVAP
jgi:hypothetical protein